MSGSPPASRPGVVLGAATGLLAVVLAIVALNNATDPQVVLPIAVAVAGGLIGLGIAARRHWRRHLESPLL